MNLFETKPTHRTKLEVWKERYGVTTRRYDEVLAGEARWEAYLHGFEYQSGSGTSELAACHVLAESLNIPGPDQIMEKECRL